MSFAALSPRQRYVRFGALGGDSLVRANTIVNALYGRWFELQRRTAEAVSRGDLPQARQAEIDALEGEIQALTNQITEIDAPQIEAWASWSQDIDGRLRTFESNNAEAIASSRRIRAIKVGVGFGAAALVAGAVGYTVWRNRKGSRA
jgi:hypothetical protein